MNSTVNIRLPNAPTNIKFQLANSAQVNATDISNLAKQVLKGSKSAETLGQAHRIFAATESSISNSLLTLQKHSALVSHLGYQQEAIEESVKKTEDVCEQLNTIRLQSSLK
ncbi:unnamed protein product [Clavelina lepadiformis]|uniref:BLOC-1-related complex subunit 7 n=1 Tax=Clavelina lepadiformis TaxID=159417 RepID=A0ABP0GHV0_CLALP